MKERGISVTSVLGSCFVGICVLLLLFFVLFPPGFGNGKEAARRTAALSNAKQCGIALYAYASDSDGIYPYVQRDDSLVRLLAPYSKGDYSAWQWETLHDGKNGKFTFNYSLAGAAANDVPDLVATPAIVDPFGRFKSGSDEAQFLASFVDTHARYIPQSLWPPYRANLSLNLKRHGKPLK